jgi:hypothetical protein
MKIHLFIACFLLLGTASLAQSKSNKLSISVGGGSQKYRGDLGNGFKLKNDVWTGGVVVNVGYYINKSFNVGLFGSMGDFGFCQPDNVANKEVSVNDRCPGCIGRVGLGNLSSRMTSGGMLLKYKLNNGQLLREDMKLRPYVCIGAAMNHLADRMNMKCVRPGNYFSINSGLGVNYYLNERVNIGYNLAFGYFTCDYIDFMGHGGTSDMYMQNTLSIGIDLF